ncbi:MAG: DNA repair protein RecO [Patescibacteria group bacterium]
MLAITLSRRDFRERDQQISFYTKESGRIETVARGIKKITARNAPALEPFALLEIELARGRGLTYVTRAQAIKTFPSLRADLRKLLIGSYCLNLVDEVTQPGEKDEKIFNLLYELLKKVDTSAAVNNLIAYDFLSNFLGALGFAPPADKSADSSLIPYAEYHLNRKVSDIANFMKRLYN